MSNEQDTRQVEHSQIFSPQPLHRRKSSYSGKFERHRQRSEDDLEPPEPVKTPSYEDSEQQKPYLKRSSTSYYQQELESSSNKNGSRKPSLENAISMNDAYHLQQRHRNEGESVFDDPLVDKLQLNDTWNQENDRSYHSDSPNDGSESRSSYKYGDGSSEDGSEFDKSAEKDSGDIVNNVNQFKRRFSWWSGN